MLGRNKKTWRSTKKKRKNNLKRDRKKSYIRDKKYHKNLWIPLVSWPLGAVCAWHLYELQNTDFLMVFSFVLITGLKALDRYLLSLIVLPFNSLTYFLCGPKFRWCKMCVYGLRFVFFKSQKRYNMPLAAVLSISGLQIGFLIGEWESLSLPENRKLLSCFLKDRNCFLGNLWTKRALVNHWGTITDTIEGNKLQGIAILTGCMIFFSFNNLQAHIYISSCSLEYHAPEVKRFHSSLWKCHISFSHLEFILFRFREQESLQRATNQLNFNNKIHLLYCTLCFL